MTQLEKADILTKLRECKDIEFLKTIQTYINKRMDFEITIASALKAQELGQR